MGENSRIEWCTHTFNPWIGCAKISPGCAHCYAETETFTTVQRSKGRELWGALAERHVTADSNWAMPLRWDRAAWKQGVRPRVFCASLADVFEDRADLMAPRARLFHLIDRTPHLDWLLLTKRPENVLRLYGCHGVPRPWVESPPPNVWVGASIEDRKRARERLPHLRKIPAALRFLSVEPLLEEIEDLDLEGIHWVIVGGESGAKARSCVFDWIRTIIAQCRAAGVPVFDKQVGARPLGCGGQDQRLALAMRHAKGGDPEEWPEDLRVREFPR
jgi:protein gp37